MRHEAHGIHEILAFTDHFIFFNITNFDDIGRPGHPECKGDMRAHVPCSHDSDDHFLFFHDTLLIKTGI